MEEEGAAREAAPQRLRVVLRLRDIPDGGLSLTDGAQDFGCAGTLSWAERRVDLPDGLSCSFDEVFGEAESLEQVFRSSLQPLVDGITSGYNGTLFTWGAPCTGKTNTVFGKPPSASSGPPAGDCGGGGLARLAAERLFENLGELPSSLRVLIRATALEVGGIEVVDLLSQHHRDIAHDERDKLRRPSLFNGGATVAEVTSVDSLLQALSLARRRHEQRRLSLPEGLNRRHCIFSIEVQIEADACDDTSSFAAVSARLSLVDLAGAAEGAEQTRAASASTLADLARVVEVLAARANTPVPYGASPLTQLMQDALGGNCSTVMLLTALGSAEALKAEIFVPTSALQLAAKAGEVINYPVPNLQPRGGASSQTNLRLGVPRLELRGVATTGEPLSSRNLSPQAKEKPQAREASPSGAGRALGTKQVKHLQNSLLHLVVDDSVFDMSLDSTDFTEGALSLPTHLSTSTPVSPPAATLLGSGGMWGQALSPIPQAVPSPGTFRTGSPAAWTAAVASTATVKPPPMPRPEGASIDPSIVREALRRKLTEMVNTPVSAATIPATGPLKSPTNRTYRTRSSLDVSPVMSDATLSPCHTGRREAAEAALAAANGAVGISAVVAAAAAAASRASDSRQHLEGRILTVETLLEKRTLQLTKAQVKLQEVAQSASRWQSETERLGAQSAEQAGIICALERLLGQVLSRQGPEIFEDLASLDVASLTALRSFAAPCPADAMLATERHVTTDTAHCTQKRLLEEMGKQVAQAAHDNASASSPRSPLFGHRLGEATDSWQAAPSARSEVIESSIETARTHQPQRQPTFSEDVTELPMMRAVVLSTGGASPSGASPSRPHAGSGARSNDSLSAGPGERSWTDLSSHQVISPQASLVVQGAASPEDTKVLASVGPRSPRVSTAGRVLSASYAPPSRYTCRGMPMPVTSFLPAGLGVRHASSAPQIGLSQIGRGRRTPRSSECTTRAHSPASAPDGAALTFALHDGFASAPVPSLLSTPMTPPRPGMVLPPPPMLTSAMNFLNQRPQRDSERGAAAMGSFVQPPPRHTPECVDSAIAAKFNSGISSPAPGNPHRAFGSARSSDIAIGLPVGPMLRSGTPTSQPLRRSPSQTSTPTQERPASSTRMGSPLNSHRAPPARSTWVVPPSFSRCIPQGAPPWLCNVAGTGTPPAGLVTTQSFGIPGRLLRPPGTPPSMAAPSFVTTRSERQVPPSESRASTVPVRSRPQSSWGIS